MYQKRTLALSAIAVMLSTTMGVSYAYLTDYQKADNHFDIADTVISIEEEFVPPSDPKPGTIIKKIPSVKNEGDTNCLVRARVIFTNGSADFCEKPQIKEGWLSGEDGYYYWNQPLPKEQRTGPLFESIQIKEAANENELSDFEVDVYAEAICIEEENTEVSSYDLGKLQSAFSFYNE